MDHSDAITAIGWEMTREEQKEERRKAIVASAERLIRKNNNTDFPVSELSNGAGLSTATLYNLIGSKATVLYILLNRSLDHIDESYARETSDLDPFGRAIAATETASAAFTADPQLFRPLYRFLLGVEDPIHRPKFMGRALSYWISWLRPLEDAKLLPPNLGLIEFARDFQIFFAGALDLWVQNELDNEQFQAQIRHGGILRLLSIADNKARNRLLEEIERSRSIVLRAIG